MPNESPDRVSNLRPDRPDGRFTTLEGRLHARLQSLEPALAFDPRQPLQELDAWRRRVRRRLRGLLAFPGDAAPQPEPKKLWSAPRDGYELQKWEAYPEPDTVAPFLMLVPAGVSARAPGAAVMCFPGSASTKETLAGEPEIVDWPVSKKHPQRNRMAWHFVRAGLVAVAMDHPDRGERTNHMFGDSRYENGVHALWLGQTLESISVFEKWTVFRWLRKQPMVDATRIAVCGHSLGAKPALHLGVLEPRVAAVAWNDFCANWRMREVMVPTFRTHLGHYIPGMQKWFDYTDLMAALAPRPFLISEGGRTEDLLRVREAWKRREALENFSVAYYPRYATPGKRPHDHDPLYEGMSLEEFFDYANVDVPKHCFKENIVVPWLRKVLKT